MSESRNKLHSCGHCEARFASRNQLFKHLPNCGVKNTKSSSSSTSIPLEIKEHQNNGSINNDDDITLNNELSNHAIYVVGGRVRGRTLGSVERFLFSTGQWELCPTLKQNRGSHGACAVGQNVYAIGGGGFDSNLATCESLNVFRSEWEFVQPTTIYRHALVLQPFELKATSDSTTASWVIYAIGGWIDGKICSADVERYNLVSNTWTKCASMNVARRLMGAASLKDNVYVFGGNVSDGEWYTAAVERYDPYADTWTRLEDLPFSGPTSAVASGDFIYVFAHGKRAYRFNPAVTSTQVRYVPLSALPLPEWFTFDVCSYGPFIFLIGGASTGVWSRAIYRYDTRSDTWFQLPDMIRQRRRTAVAIVNIGAVTTENATAAATITSTPAAQPDKDIITNSSS